MSNIDYVIVGPGPSLADVRSTVEGITESVGDDHGWLLPDDDRASLYIKANREDAGGTVVQVHYAADPPTLGQAYARDIYDSLARSTDWDLTLDSDEAEGILATRIKSRA